MPATPLSLGVPANGNVRCCAVTRNKNFPGQRHLCSLTSCFASGPIYLERQLQARGDLRLKGTWIWTTNCVYNPVASRSPIVQTSLQFEQRTSVSNALTTQAMVDRIKCPPNATDNQQSISEAEHAILDLADYVYVQTPLKPMSKALFFISRCLLIARKGMPYDSSSELNDSYLSICTSLGTRAPIDDFDFHAVVAECDKHIPSIAAAIRKVSTLTSRTDSLGLAFNTLLRGRFESGEGLGTFLTPEEVVGPMIRMLLSVVDSEMIDRLGANENPLLFGDICGGTGRFVYTLYRLLQECGLKAKHAERAARLFDQSSLAVEFGRLNFLFDDLSPRFECVSDSLTDAAVSKMHGRFGLLATNPPFGLGKYRWSPELSSALSSEFLRVLGLGAAGDLADPSELFLFRNLDLLAPGGALAIVLPDGVIQSRRFIPSLRSYEDQREVNVSIAALVSLPVTTFSLGGTVAKTSFMIFRKTPIAEDSPLYVAMAKHVGFLKRGNRRLPDVHGNDLVNIAEDFSTDRTRVGVRVDSWRSLNRLIPTAICHRKGVLGHREEHLQFVSKTPKERHFHISVLDIDETGLIDIVAAASNRPATRGLRCQSGDILVSCINPRIWRATCVPRMNGTWTCSPEFLVLRPKQSKQMWQIYFALHRGSVIRAAQSLAGGTSSSRQRVEKEQILELHIPLRPKLGKAVIRDAGERVRYYAMRLKEAATYAAFHGHDQDFKL